MDGFALLLGTESLSSHLFLLLLNMSLLSLEMSGHTQLAIGALGSFAGAQSCLFVERRFALAILAFALAALLGDLARLHLISVSLGAASSGFDLSF